jgi:hypothetical protein
VDTADLDDILGATPKAAEPAPTPEPKKAKPAPVVLDDDDVPAPAAKKAAPAKAEPKASGGSSLLADLDELLGNKDD